MISDEQTTHPLPNVHIGQTTGRQLVAEIEASEMSESMELMDWAFFEHRNIWLPRLFSRQSETVRRRETGALDVQASSEDINFSQAN